MIIRPKPFLSSKLCCCARANNTQLALSNSMPFWYREHTVLAQLVQYICCDNSQSENLRPSSYGQPHAPKRSLSILFSLAPTPLIRWSAYQAFSGRLVWWYAQPQHDCPDVTTHVLQITLTQSPLTLISTARQSFSLDLAVPTNSLFSYHLEM